MSIGKIIASILGVLVVALMCYMLLSSDGSSVAKDSTPKVEKQEVKVVQKEENSFQTSDELNKIKELKQSVAPTNDGVSKLYLKSCAPCHAKDGKGVIAPSIVGKTKDELLVSLHDYKAGKMPNSLMKGLLDNISDENLTILADEISKFK
ncbi:c-type cytochrome [Campylobacter hyointestinalis]|uniref:c-type cytochrome n=1 Tax=Campylobacter hyointestinalis TaxID=198 RepID=UPI0015E1F272|nr:hypothetical protein [Campylobacter hyointestinalis]